MPKVPYPYEVNGKLVTGNGSLIPICSLSNRSLLPSLTVVKKCAGHTGRRSTTLLMDYYTALQLFEINRLKFKNIVESGPCYIK